MIVKNNLYFEKGLLSEDIDWTIRLFILSNKFGAINIPYYYYRQNREGSITNSISHKNVEALLNIIEKFSAKVPMSGEQKYINNFLAYEYIITLANYFLLAKNERKKVKYNIFEYQWLLKYNKNKKVKICYAFKSAFGVKCLGYTLSRIILKR